jgi:hypothetical protein
LADTEGFEPSFFSGAGLAAQRNPRPRKREIETAKRMNIDLLNSDFILLPE